MENKTDVISDAQGVAESISVPDVSTIKEWIRRDLGTSITFLTSIQQDKDLQDVMAVFLQGRIQNFKSRPDPKQVKMDFGHGPKVSN